MGLHFWLIPVVAILVASIGIFYLVIKRAGGSGLISGRKSFQKPMADGVALLNAIQDVYLCPEIDLA